MLLLLPALFGAMSTYQIVVIYTSLIVLCLFAYAFILVTNQQQFELVRLAAHDGLTGAWNRRTLDLALINLINKHHRNPVKASLIIIDIDHFKSINDVHGHHVGDQILKEIVNLLKGIVRTSDQVYRYGGEEFVLIAEDTGIKNAATLAESIRSRVEKSQFYGSLNITISLGVAELGSATSEDQWLTLADQALYRAKSEGRNRYCLSEVSPNSELLAVTA